MEKWNGAPDCYESRRAWSDQYIPWIKRICGQYMITTAPALVDQRQATDLIILKYAAGAIAARIRRREYLVSYGFDMTIRKTGSEWGGSSEYDKIMSGFADRYFYAFAEDNNDWRAGFSRWFFIDLHRWRAVMKSPDAARIVCEERRNPGDGKLFLCQNLRTFPPASGVLIAHSLPKFPYYPGGLRSNGGAQ